MPTVNVLLQLYKGGWREETAPVIENNLRIEAALGTGAIDSPEEAERVAVGQLALYAMPIVARTVAVEPVGLADTPWLSHTPGQTVTEAAAEQVVESLAFRRDTDGHLDFVAELNTHLDTPTERFELALKKMSNGTLGGTSRPAQPVNLTQPAQLYRPAGTGGGGACECLYVKANTAEHNIEADGIEVVTYDFTNLELAEGAWSLVGGSIVGPDGTAWVSGRLNIEVPSGGNPFTATIDCYVLSTGFGTSTSSIYSTQILPTDLDGVTISLPIPGHFVSASGITNEIDVVSTGPVEFNLTLFVEAFVLCGCGAPFPDPGAG